MARTRPYGLRHLNLKTRDLKKTRGFYTEVMELKVAFEGVRDMIFLRTPKGDDLLAFTKTSGRIRPDHGMDHFGFCVTRTFFKGLEKKLAEIGTEIDGRRGRNAIYFTDPNGYQIEVYCD